MGPFIRHLSVHVAMANANMYGRITALESVVTLNTASIGRKS